MWKIKYIVPLLLLSCTSLNLQQTMIPLMIQDLYDINLDFVPDKAIYSAVDKTIYIKSANRIYIYQKGILSNTIGGLGFEKSQFNKLTDINLAPDGKLLALDSFQKKIRKFDHYGNLIADISLNDLPNPALFAVASDGTLFIYDANLQEIVTFQNFGKDRLYSFGKFIIEDLKSINISGNRILVYDQKTDKTIQFSRMGQFINENKGKILFDHDNAFLLKTSHIQLVDSDRKFGLSPAVWRDFDLINGHIILIREKGVRITEIKYEEK